MRIKTVEFKMTVVTLGLLTLLWLMFTLTIPGPSHATVFFDSSFETCSTGTSSDFPCDGWDDSGKANPGHLEVTNSLAFSGTKSVKGTYDNINGSSQQPSISRYIPPSTHVFNRFAYRIAPGFQVGSNGATKITRFWGNNGYPIVWVYNKWGKYAIDMEGPYDSANNYVLYSGVAPSTTKWDQIEVEVQLNTPGQSNGLIRMWVNGVLRIEQTGKAYVGPTNTSKSPSGLLTPANNQFHINQFYIQSGLGSVYFDRVAVGNTRIGQTTGQATGDTAPPTTPTGIQVR